MVLPNPNIVFVPLDVLTAEELNQVVQNINALAALFPVQAANLSDGSITNAKIAANAVSADKINWTTMNYYHTLKTQSTALTTSFQEVGRVQITSMPVGAVFEVKAVVSIAGGDTPVYVSSLAAYGNVTTPQYGVCTTWGKENTVIGTLQRTAATDVVIVRSKKDNASATATVEECYLSVQRVA